MLGRLAGLSDDRLRPMLSREIPEGSSIRCRSVVEQHSHHVRIEYNEYPVRMTSFSTLNLPSFGSHFLSSSSLDRSVGMSRPLTVFSGEGPPTEVGGEGVAVGRREGGGGV